MSGRRLKGLGAAAFALLTLLVAFGGLARSDGEAWLWLSLIALTPAILVAFHLFPDVVRVGTSEETLARVAEPLPAFCLVLSFFMLAIVVGAALWGWVGGVAGVIVGLILVLQGLAAMRHVRRALSNARSEAAQRVADRVVRRELIFQLAVAAVGLASILLLGGFGYLRFGSIGAIVLISAQAVFLIALVPLARRARQRRERRS